MGARPTYEDLVEENARLKELVGTQQLLIRELEQALAAQDRAEEAQGFGGSAGVKAYQNADHLQNSYEF